MADSNFLKKSGVDFLTVVVARTDVERCDIEPTLAVLRHLLQDRWTVQNFRNRLSVSFSGYEGDIRELYEIPEVRRFATELDQKFPFWLYFLNLHDGALALILLCLCRSSMATTGMLVLEEGEREKFLVEHYVAVNWLFETYGLDEKENEVLTGQVSDYFEKRSKPPAIQ